MAQYDRSIIELSIKKAIATKNSRIESLMIEFKSQASKPEISQKMLLNLVKDRAIKSYGVSANTAKEYASIVAYNLLTTRTKFIEAKITEKERILLERKQEQAIQYSSLLKRKEELQNQISTLVRARTTYNDAKFESLAQKKEVELANLESEIHGFQKEKE